MKFHRGSDRCVWYRQWVSGVSALLLASALFAQPVNAQDTGLLFHLTGDRGLTADIARGVAEPNFVEKVSIRQDAVHGAYVEATGEQALSWQASGNIYAQRGTLSFYWRAREAIGPTPFPLFRVGYADHSSWDMTWLRIDWNGKGFDAFVTDNNLSRVRVSQTIDTVPRPDQWLLVTFTWDETRGVALYIDGRLLASKLQRAALDAGLDQFGPHSRIVSPHQVQSAYQFIRGGDIDDVRIYDHALEASAVAALAGGSTSNAGVIAKRDLATSQWRDEWWQRYGWSGKTQAPPYLASSSTIIRKVEFTQVYDLKQLMTAGSDGIPETTWPGVYNRSKLAGRHDYFELPDWNVYVEGGRSVTFHLPDEPWNRIEMRGAAYGALTQIANNAAAKIIAKRPQGELRSVYPVATSRGGVLRFDNTVQETPIQEFAAYYVVAGSEPEQQTLSYTVHAGADPDVYPTLDEVGTFIQGRYPNDERATIVALPEAAPEKSRAADSASKLPLLHVLIPADFRQARSGQAVGKFSYGWQGMDAGLDGIAVDIPALNVTPTHGELLPLNIRVKDPLWPGRDMLDINVAVRPGEARTVFLDTRDRLLPPEKSLYLTIAGAGEDFNSQQLDGMKLRLKFKPRAAALPEHIADRLAQARDNLAFLVEEHTNSRRLARYERLDRELGDLLRVDPQNPHGREMWAELNPEQGGVAITMPTSPVNVPKWAFLQVEDLKRVRHFIEWWIDQRQVPYGDFGGGISDDDDLTQQWPPLALMGVIPDKVTASLNALVDAAFRNNMLNGLSTIKTDELHSYEEGINAISEAMYLNYGDPKAIERLMATARAYPKIVAKGVSGHTHIVSRYFSATDVSRDSPWDWSHPYSYLIMHPGLLLADFNGDASTRALTIALADSHLAHGKLNADGQWDYPEEINAATEAARGKIAAKSRGGVAVVQIFWAAYRWTGDEKYLQPIRSELARGRLSELELINSDVIDLLGQRKTWGIALQAQADQGSRDPFTLYQAWRTSGDTKYLEQVYSDEIATAERRMWMMTEAHWWSDRVELFSDTLQRSRLGGVALRRNQMVPGHTVSWRFDTPTAAEDVGILVSDATPGHFKITAFNLTSQPLHAVMTGWDVSAGRWKVVRSVATVAEPAVQITFERTGSVDMVFAPQQSTNWEFTLEDAAAPVHQRADLGIGPDDIKAERRGLRVTVHSVGSRAAAPARLSLEDGSGKQLAQAAIPALPAPMNLQPVVAEVFLATGQKWASGMRIRVLSNPGEPEITLLNNTVTAR